LIREISSAEEYARFPEHVYKSKAVAGTISAEENTKVLLDVRGSGVIDRLSLSAGGRSGRLQFFFDGSETPSMELPVDEAMSESFPEGFIAGSALYFPLPYSRSCRIEFYGEAANGSVKMNYSIDYRSYADRVSVETFSVKSISSLKKKIAQTTLRLHSPETRKPEKTIEGVARLQSGDPTIIELPGGSFAVSEIRIKVVPQTGSDYAQAMKGMIIQLSFDGLITGRLPLSSFICSEAGAAVIKNSFTETDGAGSITSRWIMPYREAGSIALVNEGSGIVTVTCSIDIVPVVYDDRMMYFHASWYDDFASHGSDSISIAVSGGRGALKGIARTVSCHSSSSGKIMNIATFIKIDGELEYSAEYPDMKSFYNYSTSDAGASNSPFGGISAVGSGAHSFIRIMHLDGIPFNREINILTCRKEAGEKTSISTTLFWYGDNKARAIHATQPGY
jgi:hypothetical protein